MRRYMWHWKCDPSQTWLNKETHKRQSLMIFQILRCEISWVYFFFLASSTIESIGQPMMILLLSSTHRLCYMVSEFVLNRNISIRWKTVYSFAKAHINVLLDQSSNLVTK